MSKQSEAKAEQNYRKTADTCANCAHFESTIKTIKSGWYGTWHEETGKRCTLGGFAVGKTATCDRHVLVDRSKS
ncbi:hypothetical protein [Macromonas nakdongensis]|uniref:hypothetical protein n=1 Tax=Macromonas nakdongensis TaxID=1843082 RepID=UPI000C32224C|nr:hypothetical protein [Macromonas nakdongensis]